MSKKSSGSYFKNHGFNPMQIKDGSVKADLGPYKTKQKRVVSNG